MSATGSSEPDASTRPRFRRRLTAAFVIVAAVSSGFVAATTYLLVREYRHRSVHAQAVDEAGLAIALAPARLDQRSFERLRVLYESRSDARILVVGDGVEFSSSPDLSTNDVPRDLVLPADDGAPTLVEGEVAGRRTLVVGQRGPGNDDYYLFFSLDQVQEGLRELAQVLIGMWVVTVLAAAAVGRWVATRTLRPVAEAAAFAETIAAGDLSARIPPSDHDEFGTLGASFNHMADEVERLVHRLEDAAQRERRFTADVAHDLRTPLTGLTTSAALLADRLDVIPAPARRPAEIIIADISRLRDLVLELLELSRLDAGAEHPHLEPLQIDAAIAAVLAGAPQRRNAAIDVEPSGAVILADPIRLRRILANVIDNALTHGGGAVRLIPHETGDDVHIDVVDDGAGIPDSELETVFDRFYKSDRSRASGGSGLGLAIARQHARSLGGDVVAANDPAHGARFTIRLRSAKQR